MRILSYFFIWRSRNHSILLFSNLLNFKIAIFSIDLLATTGSKIKHVEALQTLNDRGAAVRLIGENKFNSSGILGTIHIFEWFRKELFVPSKDIIGRTSYTKYVENGSREIFIRAREKKGQILNTYKAPAIDKHTLDEMKRILSEYANKKGEEIPEFIFNYFFSVQPVLNMCQGFYNFSHIPFTCRFYYIFTTSIQIIACTCLVFWSKFL